MFLSNASIRRPVAMCSLLIGLVLLGMNSYRKLGLEFLPKMDIPYITVVTIYPGASPEEIETDIAKPIEDAVMSVEGIKHITTACMENVAQLVLQFHDYVDVDVAATDVREKIDLVINDFPEDAEQPQIVKYDINAKPVVQLALAGSVPLDALYDYADNELSDRLSVVPGVAEIQLVGGAEREVQILLNRDALASRGLTAMDVVTVVQGNVRTVPSGRIREGGREYSVKFDAEYADEHDIESLELFSESGSRCYLRDVGEVVMTSAELRQTASIDRHTCIGARVVKKSDANAVEVVNGVREAVGELEGALPGGMRLVWVTDDGAFIQSSVDSAATSVMQGILLTAGILFLFLYDLRSTFIVAITMPVTVLISLFVLYLLGYTLNTATLLAIGLSIGVLVTNSIVVVESIVKRTASGEAPRSAAGLGAGAVAVAVLASAGTNVVVLFPIAMMSSSVAQFFRPFAMTMVVVTVVSLFISFTLTPILAARLLRPRDHGARYVKVMAAVGDVMMDAAVGVYVRALRLFARRRSLAAVTIVVAFGLLAQALGLLPKVGMSFFDELDRGEIYVKLEYPTSFSLDATRERLGAVEGRLATLPELEHVFTTVGKVEGIVGQTSEGVYLAQVLLRFSDKTEREASIEDLLGLAREAVEGESDCIVTASIPAAIGGQQTPIEMEIAGEDLATLNDLALTVQDRARGITGVVAPDTSVRPGKPELRIEPRRPVLTDVGVPAAAIGLGVRANLEGMAAATFKEGTRTYDIRVKLVEEEGRGQVEEFLFPTNPGESVILRNFADVRESTAPVQITRKDKQRVTKLYANLEPTLPLGNAVNAIDSTIRRERLLPPGYRTRFVGDYEIMNEANADFAEAGIIAVVLTYLVLAAILESFFKPFIILTTVPLAVIGVVWALYVTGLSVSLFVLLGGVMLIGIVVNNAILIMDQVAYYRGQGLGAHEAMIQASRDEFRPIVMITLAAILGMLPMAVGSGLGSEIRVGIGVASIGGIAVSAVLTLLVLPVLYDLFTRDDSGKAGSSAA